MLLYNIDIILLDDLGANDMFNDKHIIVFQRGCNAQTIDEIISSAVESGGAGIDFHTYFNHHLFIKCVPIIGERADYHYQMCPDYRGKD